MKRLSTNISYDPATLRDLLAQHAELRDQIVIAANTLEHQEIDLSPLGNTDPDVLLKNLREILNNYTLYSYENLQWVEKKLLQSSRLKRLTIGLSDFFRQIGISVGKENVLKVVEMAERSLREPAAPRIEPSQRKPRPAKRPARKKVKA